MTLPHDYDGPRLLRPNEERASRRLSRACFGAFGGSEEEETEAPASAPAEPAEERPQKGETHVIAYQGVPVSQISIFYTPLRVYECVVGVGSIGGVCTLPEQRGHGLATVLLDHCARHLVEMGSSLMLISGGRGLYRRAGCAPTGRYAIFTARASGSEVGEPPVAEPPVRERAVTTESGLVLRPATVGDARAAARLYQSEPVHFLRPLEKFEEHFAREGFSRHAEKWMVERDGRAVAYLLLDNEWEHALNPERGLREVSEYAGSRSAVAEAVCAAVERGGLRALKFSVPWQDAELVDLLERRLGAAEIEALDGHTMRLLDFPGMMTGLHDYMRARLPAHLLRGLTFEQAGGLIVSGDLFGQPYGDPDPGRCAIARGQDRLELDTEAMTKLVMGDPAGSGNPDGSTVHLPGALGEIAAALFPLPSFLPGLDYH